jgi:hypothetical protein
MVEKRGSDLLRAEVFGVRLQYVQKLTISVYLETIATTECQSCPNQVSVMPSLHM